MILDEYFKQRQQSKA